MHANLFKPALLTSLILLAACSEEPYSPIVDGRKSANFQQDLGACRTVAQKAQLSNQSTTAGAVVGGLVGAADADDGDELEGAIAGAVVGGLIIGIIETLAGFYLPPGFKNVAAYVVLLVVLVVRPQGLFGQKTGKRV